MIDNAPLKQGKYLTGSKIAIVSPKMLNDPLPTNILIFQRNLVDEIVHSDRIQYGIEHTFSTAIPQLKVSKPVQKV